MLYRIFDTRFGSYAEVLFEEYEHALNYIKNNYDVDDREYIQVHLYTLLTKYNYPY